MVARALTVACRSSDIVGRLGGDEFVILLTEADDVANLESRVRNALLELGADFPHPIGVSIGVDRCDAHPECHLEDLFAAAGRAMYGQKAGKRAPRPGPRPA